MILCLMMKKTLPLPVRSGNGCIPHHLISEILALKSHNSSNTVGLCKALPLGVTAFWQLLWSQYPEALLTAKHLSVPAQFWAPLSTAPDWEERGEQEHPSMCLENWVLQQESSQGRGEKHEVVVRRARLTLKACKFRTA